MRVAAAGKKTLRKGDKGGVGRRSLVRFENHSLAKRILNADAGRAGEDEALLWRAVLAELMVRRILQKDAAEVGFRTEVSCCDASIERGIRPFRGFQRAVAAVANQSDRRNADPGWLRQNRDQVRTDDEIA